MNYNNPQLGKDLVKVMNAFGVGVQLLKKEKCCGVALISNGFINQARKQARVISDQPEICVGTEGTSNRNFINL